MPTTLPAPRQRVGLTAAAAIVVANMVGTGVFTSLGFQVVELRNTATLLLLWAVGGLIAGCGALAYAELGARYPRSGGEVVYLRETLGPRYGFLTAWVSASVGFAAPIALASYAVGAYVGGALSQNWIATATVLAFALVHARSASTSGAVQTWITALKVAAVLAFVVVGLALPPAVTPAVAAADAPPWWRELASPASAVALVYVLYAYSGWNAAAYVTGELRRPRWTLPRALLLGTGAVAIAYVLLNFVFLRHASLDALAGQLDVGEIVARELFGPTWGRWFGLAIGLLLLSTVSAMTWAGPRVTAAAAADLPRLRALAATNASGVPVAALALQTALSLAYVWTGTFETVLLYSGFVLQLLSALVVAVAWRCVGAAYVGGDEAAVFRAPLRPWPHLLFLAASAWILAYLAYERPATAIAGAATLGVGLLLFEMLRFRKTRHRD